MGEPKTVVCFGDSLTWGFDPRGGEVLAARADAPPVRGVLSPSLDHRVDGADMPALVLPPPASVRFEVAAEKLGFRKDRVRLTTELFTAPKRDGEQLALF